MRPFGFVGFLPELFPVVAVTFAAAVCAGVLSAVSRTVVGTDPLPPPPTPALAPAPAAAENEADDKGADGAGLLAAAS